MIEIVLLDKSKHCEEIKEIFFLSSSIKSFSTEERKEDFFKRWCGDYILHYSDQFYVMVDGDTKKVLGYLSGCDNSIDSLSKLVIPGPECFKDMFEEYPAHFHINFHPDCRGKGFGSKLVEYYCRKLVTKNIPGVHIITSTDANNISFYRQMKFSYENVQVFGKAQLLFMGLKIC